MTDHAIPPVTVIMPTFNQDQFIARALSCLLKQTFTEWELIIVNDGSTDLTYHTVQQYVKDERIQYLQHTTNKGLGTSINSAYMQQKESILLICRRMM